MTSTQFLAEVNSIMQSCNLDPVPCNNCNGTGIDVDLCECLGGGCYRCKGSGVIPKQCKECKGKGEI